MAKDTGSAGEVIRIDGIASERAVALKIAVIARTVEVGDGDGSGEWKNTRGRIRTVASATDKRDKSLNDLDRFCFIMSGCIAPLRAAYKGIVEPVVKLNAMTGIPSQREPSELEAELAASIPLACAYTTHANHAKNAAIDAHVAYITFDVPSEGA